MTHAYSCPNNPKQNIYDAGKKNTKTVSVIEYSSEPGVGTLTLYKSKHLKSSRRSNF